MKTQDIIFYSTCIPFQFAIAFVIWVLGRAHRSFPKRANAGLLWMGILCIAIGTALGSLYIVNINQNKPLYKSATEETGGELDELWTRHRFLLHSAFYFIAGFAALFRAPTIAAFVVFESAFLSIIVRLLRQYNVSDRLNNIL